MEALDTNEVVGWKESLDQVPTSTATSNGGGAPFEWTLAQVDKLMNHMCRESTSYRERFAPLRPPEDPKKSGE